MSHFPVLVIGDLSQLEPFNENLRVDPYPEYIDHADMNLFLEWANEKAGTTLEDGSARNGTHCDWGHISLDFWQSDDFQKAWDTYTDGEEIYYDTTLGFYRYSSYNPDSKWDWWVVGGRWPGLLKLKDGTQRDAPLNFSWGWEQPEAEKERAEKVADLSIADQARFGDVDWEAMYLSRLQKHAEAWSEWEDFLASGPTDEEINHRAYWDFGVHNVAVVEEPGRLKDNPEHWRRETEEEYMVRNTQGGFTYALVKNRIWYQRGEMGWFGMSNDFMSATEWWEVYQKQLENTTDDELVTVVDCHI